MSTRRKFIKNAGILGTAPFIMGGLLNCKNETQVSQAAIKAGFTLENFGIQLWTVRDAMAEDVRGTFEKLSKFGYTQIESFQGDKGITWGMKPKEYKDYLQSHGLTCISSHCDSTYSTDISKRDEFKKLVEDAASIGIKYLINPYMGSLKTIDEFKAAATAYNELGEITKASGIRYGYHNHHYSFTKMEDVFPQDIMMEGTDADLVDFEMDYYWVVTAGQDPIAWLKKYPNRFKLCHIKDRYTQDKIDEIAKTEEPNGSFGLSASCVLGEGQINFNELLLAAREQGMQEWIVEQERYDAMTSMEAAQKDATYMMKYSKG